MKIKHLLMICPLSSRQVKYLKLSADDAYISLLSVGIFLCTPFLFVFIYSLVFRNRVFIYKTRISKDKRNDGTNNENYSIIDYKRNIITT